MEFCPLFCSGHGAFLSTTTPNQPRVIRMNTQIINTKRKHKNAKGEKRRPKQTSYAPAIQSIKLSQSIPQTLKVTESLFNNSLNPVQKNIERTTHMLASSRPRSFTGVPDFGETKQLSDSSSRPIIRPGHHDPLRRRTQTKPPTDASMALVLLDPSKLPISKAPGRPTFPIPRFQKQMHI